jgi:GAF domain-containing protein
MSTVNGKTGEAKVLLELRNELALAREQLEEKTREAAANGSELFEAREIQTALSEVLSIISRGPNQLQPVFDGIIRIASRLCETDVAFIFRTDGDVFRIAATEPAKSEYIDYLEAHPIKLDRTTHVGRAALEGKTVYIADREADPEYSFPGWQKLTRIRSQLAVPLLRDERPIGVIALSRNKVEPFTPEQVRLAETFADQAIIAVENARLFEAEQQRTEELRESLEYQTATSEVLSVISRSPHDLQPVLDVIVETSVRLCRSTFGHVRLLQDDGTYHITAHKIDDPELVAQMRDNPFHPGQDSIAGRAALEGRTIHVADVAADPLVSGFQRQISDKVRTAMSVPLKRNDEVIGLISVFHDHVRPFTDRQIKLVETFADQAIIAIENARLFEAEQQRTEELRESLEYQTATSEVLRVISGSTGDLRPVLQAVIETAVRLCGADRGHVFRYDGEYLEYSVAFGTSQEFLDKLKGHRFQPGPGSATRRAAYKRQTVHIEDVLQDPDYDDRGLLGAQPYSSVLAVPIQTRKELLGVIAIPKTYGEPFTQRQIKLVETFADQVVIAINNARLFEAEQERTEELRESLDRQTASSDILRVISTSLTDTQPVFDAIVQAGHRLIPGSDLSIALVDGETVKLAAFASSDTELVSAWRTVFPHPLTREYFHGVAILDKRIVDVADVLEAPAEQDPGKKNFIASGYRANTCIPLMRGDRSIGAIAVPRMKPGPLNESQLDLLQTFADQAVIAIENARLFAAEQQSTRELRESLEYQTATSEVLNVISRSPTDANPVFDIIGERAERLCDAEISVVSMLEGNLIRLVSVHGTSPAGVDAIERAYPMARSAETVTARSIRNGAVVHVADVLADPLYEQKHAARAGGYRCCLGVPMLREGNVVGTIFVARTRPDLFTESQVKLLQTFADQAVIAIENVRLFEEVQARTKALTQSVEELRALDDVGRTVSSTLDLAKVLQTVLENACRMTSAGSGTIYVFDPESGEFRLEAGYNMSAEHTARVKAHPMRIGDPVIGECAESRAALQIEDVAEEDRERSPLFDILLRSGVRALLAVPLLRRNEAMGILVVRRMYPGAFSSEAVRLLEAFAAQSAIAINNARLFTEVEETGRALAIASQHKSQFLANMSHELRTPLNAILGYTELIQDGLYGEPNPKVNEVLSRVQSNGKHLLGLINDVLDLSKIEAGELTLSHDAYSMSDAIQTVISATEALAFEKALKLDAEVPANLPTARGDERRLVQVLLNLVGNAIKFTDTGEVKVSVQAKDDRFVIDVADTGPGIPDNEIGRIFEEFHQVDSSATKRKGGTGLGLAISKRIVELHGGQLAVSSEVGKGSTFRVDLPVRFETVKVADDDKAHTRH